MLPTHEHFSHWFAFVHPFVEIAVNTLLTTLALRCLDMKRET